MTVQCKSCGWEGPEDVLEYFCCPSCGSRNLKTDGKRLEKEDTPSQGDIQGGMGT